MLILAHTETAGGSQGLFELWELHPATVHFPLALLLSAVALDLYAWWRDRPGLLRPVAGLLAAGVLTGVVAAVAGLLAFFIVPAHTEEAHTLMYWHLGVTVAALAIFAWPAWVRWRAGLNPPSRGLRLAGVLGALLIAAGGALGGHIVYRGGAGVDPKILAPKVRAGHSHGDEPKPATPEQPAVPSKGKDHKH